MNEAAAGVASVDSSLNTVSRQNTLAAASRNTSGAYVNLGGELFYAIRDVDRMPPFLISVVSGDDHWLYASSTGGLAAGRVQPEYALFPYITDDKIHDSAPHTGSKTLFRVRRDGRVSDWEPFNRAHDERFAVSRSVYKNLLGNKLCFEEVNHDLKLAFRYTWTTSDEFGFVRSCELENTGGSPAHAELLDGLQNILPAGTPMVSQANASNLVNAYKWSELDEGTGLACFTLYSEITDRAEPCESLRATTVFSLGMPKPRVLLSAAQLDAFRHGETPEQESVKRGVRGAYFLNAALDLAPGTMRSWQIVANLEQDQGNVAALRRRLAENPAEVFQALSRSIDRNSDTLARIMGSADGFQAVDDENEALHHYANVLFNTMRGGTFADQYRVPVADFTATIRHFNRSVYERNAAFLSNLPQDIGLNELLQRVTESGDAQLERLAREYLPLTFGRRHGDPSRPWNHFSIRLKDETGARRLYYQGNWRDIFQNWEALTFSYPEFIESVIAKFVNASTVDGYNPYRIGKDGIDWEVEEPDDPWSYIGYWGDHQIVYLLKLLELSARFHPRRLHELLRRPVYSYANVPYRIKPFDQLLATPKDTVVFDVELAARIDARVAAVGADGKLLQDSEGSVWQVNLLEKLLVPLLAKLGNLVPDGGIWLNTQRPEWNDANNALVGHGLSVVTLCYLRRYSHFLLDLLDEETMPFEVSAEVGAWLDDTRAALVRARVIGEQGAADSGKRYEALAALGQAADRYRHDVYQSETFGGKCSQPVDQIRDMLREALEVIDRSLAANRREDGLFHSYNLLALGDEQVSVDNLYPMLEGQVAALSAGTLSPEIAVSVLEALFASDIYRPDQDSFMLYPDRTLPRFMEKNRAQEGRMQAIPLLSKLLAEGDESLVYRDADGWCRFNAGMKNIGFVRARLDALAAVRGAEVDADRQAVEQLYEEIFHHRAFTGRSGTMFGYEGLGSIYWHMVSKLLLAVQENFFAALEPGVPDLVRLRLGQLYYKVRQGLGFNKTPAEYGAFPTDPYSHTPKHNGASQPGMTGQVKEEVLSRFGELGLQVANGAVSFRPRLLRRREFPATERQFRFLDVEGQWQLLQLPPMTLAFTWCQVPVVYRLDDESPQSVAISWDNGSDSHVSELRLPPAVSREIFRRTHRVRRLTVTLGSDQLFRG